MTLSTTSMIIHVDRMDHLRYVKATALKFRSMGFKILSVEHHKASSLRDVSDDELRCRVHQH